MKRVKLLKTNRDIDALESEINRELAANPGLRFFGVGLGLGGVLIATLADESVLPGAGQKIEPEAPAKPKPAPKRRAKGKE